MQTRYHATTRSSSLAWTPTNAPPDWRKKNKKKITAKLLGKANLRCHFSSVDRRSTAVDTQPTFDAQQHTYRLHTMQTRKGRVPLLLLLLLAAVALLIAHPAAAATDPTAPAAAPTSADDAAKTTGVAESSASGSGAATTGTSGAAATATADAASAAAAALSRRLDDEARQVKYVVGLLAAAPAKPNQIATVSTHAYK